MKRKGMGLVGLFLLVAISFVAAANIPKDTLVLASNTEIFKTFDPGVCFEVEPSIYVKNIYANLVTLRVVNDAFTPVADLAEKWEQSQDGKVWTFYLRKGVKFANGDTVKASDVEYSYRRAIKLNKSPAWLFTDTLGLTEDSIKAVNDTTVTIATNGAPANVVLSVLAANIGGVLCEKEVKAHETNGDMGLAWLTDHSAGAGPYVLKEWRRKTQIALTVNKNYYGGQPAIKTILMRDVPEASDRYLLLKKGDVDVAWQITVEQAASLRDTKGGDVSLVSTPAQSLEYVAVNASWGPFKDVRVRQAIKYAIDYDAIINKVREGFAIKNQQFLAIGYFGYKESNPFTRDVAKAKKLLADAGYANGFEVEIVTNESEVRRAQAVVVQSNLADLGIKSSIVIMQAAQMYDKYRNQSLQMIVAGWGIDYPDADALAKPFADYTVKQLAWRNAWIDDKAAAMASAAGKEINEQKRAQIYYDLVKYWQDNGPFAMLYQPIEYWGIRKEVKGYEKAFEGYNVHCDFTLISK
jgi:peptide/nickel transport system substrate-binding protein